MGYTAMARMVTSRKIKYSIMEMKLIELLSKGEATASDLIKKIYRDGEAPYFARESITSILRALIKKLDHNNETFTISKTRPGGPYETKYKRVKRS